MDLEELFQNNYTLYTATILHNGHSADSIEQNSPNLARAIRDMSEQNKETLKQNFLEYITNNSNNILDIKIRLVQHCLTAQMPLNLVKEADWFRSEPTINFETFDLIEQELFANSHILYTTAVLYSGHPVINLPEENQSILRQAFTTHIAKNEHNILNIKARLLIHCLLTQDGKAPHNLITETEWFRAEPSLNLEMLLHSEGSAQTAATWITIRKLLMKADSDLTEDEQKTLINMTSWNPEESQYFINAMVNVKDFSLLLKFLSLPTTDLNLAHEAITSLSQQQQVYILNQAINLEDTKIVDWMIENLQDLDLSNQIDFFGEKTYLAVLRLFMGTSQEFGLEVLKKLSTHEKFDIDSTFIMLLMQNEASSGILKTIIDIYKNLDLTYEVEQGGIKFTGTILHYSAGLANLEYIKLFLEKIDFKSLDFQGKNFLQVLFKRAFKDEEPSQKHQDVIKEVLALEVIQENLDELIKHEDSEGVSIRQLMAENPEIDALVSDACVAYEQGQEEEVDLMNWMQDACPELEINSIGDMPQVLLELLQNEEKREVGLDALTKFSNLRQANFIIYLMQNEGNTGILETIIDKVENLTLNYMLAQADENIEVSMLHIAAGFGSAEYIKLFLKKISATEENYSQQNFLQVLFNRAFKDEEPSQKHQDAIKEVLALEVIQENLDELIEHEDSEGVSIRQLIAENPEIDALVSDACVAYEQRQQEEVFYDASEDLFDAGAGPSGVNPTEQENASKLMGDSD